MPKKKKSNKPLAKAIAKARREAMMKAGLNDGRLKTRVANKSVTPKTDRHKNKMKLTDWFGYED